MKHQNLNIIRSLLIATALLAALCSTRTFAADPGVLPVNARPYGKTYGQWVVAYWQWALGIPAATNPWATDTTGEFAGVGQGGPVWFLGGTAGGSATRTFSMPVGKGIFMPIHQWIFGASVYDCEPSVPGVTCDVPTLRAAAAAAAATAIMQVFIDGMPVSDPSSYRAVSPSSFSVTLPADNVVGLPAGTYAPQVADGYYLMLAPLAVGPHTIQVHAVNPPLGIEYSVTYNITVTPPAFSAPTAAD